MEGASQILHQTRCQYIVNEPFAPMLLKGNIAGQAFRKQHLMRRLQNALQVRWITLSERQLFGELIKSNSPRHGSVFSRHLE